MNPKEDLYATNWHSIITAARMCKVQTPPADAETITVPRTVFDDLIRVAEVATRLQHDPCPPAEVVIHRREGQVTATIIDPRVPPSSVTKPTLLQALSEAGAPIRKAIDEFIR